MEWSPVYPVAAIGFLAGIVFGIVAAKTNFCTMGAVSDWVNMGSKNRLRAWLLAIGIAVLLSQAMQHFGLLRLDESIYLASKLNWLAHVLGGVLFGVGMTLASGCGQRTLVRLGGGNLKSLVVLLFLALTAYMTMRGLLAPLRLQLTGLASIDLGASGIAGQGVDSLVAHVAGLEHAGMARLLVAGALGLGLILYAFACASFRRSFDDVLAGIVIGIIVPAGWYITGVIGFDDFEPVRLESFTFVAPSANSLQYLMTFTGSTINFGIAAVGGVILGAFLFAVGRRRFRVETFVVPADMIRHIAGGILMGFGGVLALGCTIGQGITGTSTLALGSFLALLSIVFGSALTMKVEYHLLDDQGFITALRLALADLRLMPQLKTPGSDADDR
jgi:uncharacterized membrane protein YedE/YeeE